MKLIYKAFTFALFCIFFMINVNASTYIIEELELSIIIPEGFYTISRSSSSSDIQSINLDPILIKDRMLNFNSYLLLYNFESEIHISKIENSFTKDIQNLGNVNQDIINSLGEGYSKEFGDYEIYETDSIKYLVFEYSLNTTGGVYYYLKYKTIVNGMEITVNYINPAKFSTTDKNLMIRIINSLAFDNDFQPEKSNYNIIYIIGVILLILLNKIIFRKNINLFKIKNIN